MRVPIISTLISAYLDRRRQRAWRAHADRRNEVARRRDAVSAASGGRKAPRA